MMDFTKTGHATHASFFIAYFWLVITLLINWNFALRWA